jgi:hypothetical protein
MQGRPASIHENVSIHYTGNLIMKTSACNDGRPILADTGKTK